jgi:hypothetical protein
MKVKKLCFLLLNINIDIEALVVTCQNLKYEDGQVSHATT